MHRKDLARQELIGLEAEVTEAKNKDLKGIKGIIIDETKNTLTIEHDNKKRIVLKEQVTLKIKIKDQFVRMDGETLLGRAEDRLKK